MIPAPSGGSNPSGPHSIVHPPGSPSQPDEGTVTLIPTPPLALSARTWFELRADGGGANVIDCALLRISVTKSADVSGRYIASITTVEPSTFTSQSWSI